MLRVCLIAALGAGLLCLLKIAFNLAVAEAGPGWSRVVTETRIRATDDAALKIMSRYWRLIYPGTGMIRRMWLNAVRERAEHEIQARPVEGS